MIAIFDRLEVEGAGDDIVQCREGWKYDKIQFYEPDVNESEMTIER